MVSVYEPEFVGDADQLISTAIALATIACAGARPHTQGALSAIGSFLGKWFKVQKCISFTPD